MQPENILCRDINGRVHIVSYSDLVPRSSVYAVIQQSPGYVFARDRTSNSTWDLPGGGIEVGEDQVTALAREIKEETGLEIVGEPNKIIEFTEYFYDLDSSKGWESTRSFYQAECIGSLRNSGNSDDIDEVGFITDPVSSPQVSAVAKAILKFAQI